MDTRGCTDTEDLRNVPLTAPPNFLSAERLASRCNSKQRKKKLPMTKDTAQEVGVRTKHFTDPLLRSSVNTERAQVPSYKGGRSYRDRRSEQRNLGSPVIVEALLEDLSSLSIPKAFRRCREAKTDTKAPGKCDSNARSASIAKGKARVVIARSVKPKDGVPRDKGNDRSGQKSAPKETSKPRANRERRAENANVRTNNSSVYERHGENTNCERSGTNDAAMETERDLNSSLNANRFARPTVDRSAPRFYSVRNKVVVIMESGSRLCFTGKLIVKTMYGAVKVYGSTIKAENGPVEVYSPRGYSSVAIENSDHFSREGIDVWESLLGEGITRDVENKLVADVNRIQPGAAIVLLSNLENKLTQFLDVFHPYRLFPKVENSMHYSWTDPRRAEVILQSNLYFGNFSCKELVVGRQLALEVTEKMLNRWRANEWSCTVIAGGKGVGKSTATRYVINGLLPVSKMAILLDVDPGQAEMTPPGCISCSLIEEPLMGPNFTHLKTPLYQLYIGDVNVSRCITRYIEGIKMLVDKLTSCPTLSRLPIVVNTMGFTHGIGWDIAIFAIKLIRPSLVVQIMSEKAKNNYNGFLSKEVVNQQELAQAAWSTNVVDWSRSCDHELCVLPSQAENKSITANESWGMKPYQQRELVMISYLSEIIKSPRNATSFYRSPRYSFNINEVVPYAAPFSSLTISIPRSSVPPSHALSVLNGNVAALCGIDTTSDDSPEIQVSSGLRVLTKLPLCTCYGFGIVRGVDVERERVFINTSLPASMMQRVNCLVGCIPIPATLLQLNQQQSVPYTGESDVLPMGRDPRRGYFQTRHQNLHGDS